MPITYAIGANGGISAFVRGQMYVVPADHRNREKVVTAIRENDEDAFLNAFDLSFAVNDFLSPSGKLKVEKGKVYYKGSLLQFSFVNRLLQIMEEGFPCFPYVNYIERTMRNKRPQCLKALDKLINNENAKYPLPILEDGRIMGYKRITDDYFDFHTKKCYYPPLDIKYKADSRVTDSAWLHAQRGHRVRMNWWDADDNPNVPCSRGFHIGMFEYVNDFHAGSGVIVAVVTCPSDVVSVPSDIDQMKFRTCAMEIRHRIEETFVRSIFGLEPIYRSSLTGETDAGEWPSVEEAEDYKDDDDLEDGDDDEVYENN